MASIDAGGHRIDYEWTGPQPGESPTLVLLHEGLGSVALWRDFPQALADATGLGVLAYSRRGYGKSEPAPVSDFPLPVDYMVGSARDELRDLLRALGVERPILLGHSDGASIALIYAGMGLEPAPRGLIVMAPHVFVEQITTISIARARVAYEADDLREKLARYHDDVDGAFYLWNAAWMRPAFKDWNIEDFLPAIRCPITVLQGEDDEYGTGAQADAIARQAGGPVDVIMLGGCGHSPHRDQRERTIEAIVHHVADAAKAAA